MTLDEALDELVRDRVAAFLADWCDLCVSHHTGPCKPRVTHGLLSAVSEA